jgi:hypothetical protein
MEVIFPPKNYFGRNGGNFSTQKLLWKNQTHFFQILEESGPFLPKNRIAAVGGNQTPSDSPPTLVRIRPISSNFGRIRPISSKFGNFQTHFLPTLEESDPFLPKNRVAAVGGNQTPSDSIRLTQTLTNIYNTKW